MADMGSAAELPTIVADGINSDLIGVFLFEKGQGAGLDGLVIRHSGSGDWEISFNFFIDGVFDFLKFFGGKSFVITKIETKSLGRQITASLMNTGAQNITQSLVEKMGGGVILGNNF